jgi:DNA-binding XRE family transcriptional regulator
MPSPLDNYLRAHRRKSGLTQKELAFLVGRDVASIHRHEQKHGLPTLRTALAYCLILGVPIDKLFAGIQRGVGVKLTRRIAQLRADVSHQGRTDLVKRLAETRLRWLDEQRRVRNRKAIE